MTYPYPSDDGGSVLIRARTRPGDPTTLNTFIVSGEDKQLRDLTLVVATCNVDHTHFPALTDQRTCTIDCPTCGRGYTLEFDPNNEPVWMADRPLELN